MRIVYVGAVEFSEHCLREVLENGGNVVAIITLAPQLAGVHSDFADLSTLAAKYEVPIYKLDQKINVPENVRLIRSLKPDVIFLLGWSQIVSRSILEIPTIGCIGSHPALLPKNRGRHPIIWALVDGLEKSGLTFFFLDEGVDSGDILWQKSFPITQEDDARSLYDKINKLAREGIREFLPQLQQGHFPRVTQDHEKATYWRRRTIQDGIIDWSSPTITIHNLVRALTHPYVGAHTYLNSEEVIIWRTELPLEPLSSDEQKLSYGTIIDSFDGGLKVRTGDGYSMISDYETEVEMKFVPGVKLGATGESSRDLSSSR